MPTLSAFYASEALPGIAADKHASELSLHVLRKRLAIVLARVLQERLEILAHQHMQNTALRLSPLVLEALALAARGCCLGHGDAPERAACQQDSTCISWF